MLTLRASNRAMQHNEKAVTAKLVICRARRELQQLPIDRGTMRIGRRPHNDIVLDDLTVSGDHAAIDTDPQGSTVRDLGSRNGTLVNGLPAGTRRLAHDDVIEIGIYRLRYIVERRAGRAAPPAPVAASPVSSSPASRVPLTDRASAPAPAALSASSSAPVEQLARLCWLSGPKAGSELVLARPINRIGDEHVAVIAQRRSHWSITHVEGLGRPLVNGVPIAPGPHALAHDDLIELGGTMLQFRLLR